MLRLYRPGDDVLSALMRRFLDADEDWLRVAQADAADPLHLVALAEHGERNPGRSALFAFLSGTATAPSHPAHDFFRERYRDARKRTAAALATLAIDDASGEAVRLLAAWDGLQIHARYTPAGRAAPMLAYRLALLGADVRDAAPRRSPSPSPTALDPSPAARGYPAADALRARAMDSARAELSDRGYHGLTIQAVADRAGIPKSTLLHHYPSKPSLLAAVLAERDASIAIAPVERTMAPEDALRHYVGRTSDDAEPPMVALYTVLFSEATAPAHPAHAYFRERHLSVRAQLAPLFDELHRSGSLPRQADPALEAEWFAALRDGIQIQSLYESAISIRGTLDAYLDRLLSRSP
ncbi:TetR/AcrR family transcriptional regulator [Microbacterium sp. NPDC055683]